MNQPNRPLFPELRPFQLEALNLLYQRGPLHLLCIAATGSGKSLIYEHLASSGKHRVLLMTPLIALARQQRERLASLGIALGDRTGPPPKSGAWILSPESLTHPSRMDQLKRWSPDVLVVDECHCLWDWGEGFRPSFNRIPSLVEELGIEKSLWLTATLPPDAKSDLAQRLPGNWREVGSFALPPRLRLSLIRSPSHERAEAVLHWIARRDGAGILFAPTRQKAERIASLMIAHGITAAHYHAGLGIEERRIIEQKLQRAELEIVVATSAFGMGVHIPSLRWALLWQAPPSLLALAQAIGRVGRDPNHVADAAVFWDDADFRLNEWMTMGSDRKREDASTTYRFLNDMRCRGLALHTYFNSTSTDTPTASPCGRCDICTLLKY